MSPRKVGLSRWSFSAALLLALALAVPGSGCGPSRYISVVTFDARRVLKQAEQLKAAERAPYEYWSAVEYLTMAREKGAQADFEVALKYGDRAVERARQARDRAAKVAREQRQENPIPADLSQGGPTI